MRNSYQMQQELQGPSSLMVANNACKNANKANSNSTLVQTAQEHQEIGTISKNTQCDDEPDCSANGKTGKRASLELLI